MLLCLLSFVVAVAWRFTPQRFETTVQEAGGYYARPVRPGTSLPVLMLHRLQHSWRKLTGTNVKSETIVFPSGTLSDTWLHEHRQQFQNHDQLQLIMDGTSISDAGLQAFANMTCLVHLTVNRTKISDSSLKLLGTCHNLRAIGIAHTAISAHGLQKIAAYPALEAVAFDVSQVTDESLAAICQNKGVTHLTIFGATDRTAAQLTSFCSGKKMMLFESELTHESIPDLTQIDTIQSLTFADPDTSLEKWRRFKSALDGCQIPRPTEVETRGVAD